jgi:signal transduction histidine kinase
MSVQQNLVHIRSIWVARAIDRMARQAGVRLDFQDQLNQFYDLLIQAEENSDATRLDPLLHDWSTSLTQSDLHVGPLNVVPVLNNLLTLTYEIAREMLDAKEAMELLCAVLPTFTYALDKAALFEMKTRVTYISNELAAAQLKLERLDRNKSKFIAVAAHELKTPLTLIEGYSAMVREMVKAEHGDSIDTLLNGIHTGVKRLQTIVDDMIDVSLIDNNMLTLNFQPLWLYQIFNRLDHTMKEPIKARSQRLTIHDFPGSGEMIFGDQERLYQAFRNILNNAIKYTPDGGAITVDGRTLPGFIEVTFADTGIGISPENQSLIFEKFEQVGTASLHSSSMIKFKGGGPGLGLSITRGIIEAHGGMIWVESPGHDEKSCPGSVFHVLLPIHTEPLDPKLIWLLGIEKRQTHKGN